MVLSSAARSNAVWLCAFAYVGGCLWLAATGTGGLLAPLAFATSVLVPFATGLASAPGDQRPRFVAAILRGALAYAIAGAILVTVGALPLAYFRFVQYSAGGALAVGALLGAFFPDARIRIGMTVMAAIAPFAVAQLEQSPEGVSDVTVASQADLAFPSRDVWEEVIGSDSLAQAAGDSSRFQADPGAPVTIALDDSRAGAERRIVFADGSMQVERIAEWEEGDWLRVIAAPRSLEPPRGLAAWRAGWGEGLVVQRSASYSLNAPPGSPTTLAISASYSVATHARAYPSKWIADIAQRRTDVLLETIRERTASRTSAGTARLTADMRFLRRRLLGEVNRILREDTVRRIPLPMFINAEGAVELVDPTLPSGSARSTALNSTLLAVERDTHRARIVAWVAPLSEFGNATTLTGDSATARYEDFDGHCVAERFAYSEGGIGESKFSACAPTVMAGRVAGSKLLAQLPLSAGDDADNWSVPLVARGTARVFRDSVVIRTDTLRFRVKSRDGLPQIVDSINISLSKQGERAWYTARAGDGLALGRSFEDKAEWSRARARFVVPVDSAFDLATAWPTFQVVLSVPKTAENTVGRAWTYAHTPMAFFESIKRD